MTTLPWFHRTTLYQIYPRSFYDSNGDGIGDLGTLAGADLVARGERPGVTRELFDAEQFGAQRRIAGVGPRTRKSGHLAASK